MSTNATVTLELLGFYSGRGPGPEPDLSELDRPELEQASVQLATLAIRCLGSSLDERLDELARLSMHLQMSDLEHPEVIEPAVRLLAAIVMAGDDVPGPQPVVQDLPAASLPLLARRLGWLAYGLLGDDDYARDEHLRHVSLMLQLVTLGEP